MTQATETTGKAAGTTTNAPGIALRTSAYRAHVGSITRRDGWNNRFDFGEIEELAKSIKANGLLNPLRVKRIAGAAKDAKFQFELIDGDRRLTALELLVKNGHESNDGVPVIIVDKGQDDLTSLIQMFEANTGKPLLPLEEASAYQRMRDAGLTIKQICERVGRKQVHVVATLALMTADSDVTEAIKEGSVNSTLAKKIAVHARGDKVKQKELVAQAKAAGQDKAKKQAVKAAVEKSRQDKAKKAGKKLKIQPLTPAQVSDLGQSLAVKLAGLLQDSGRDLSTDLRAWVGQDEEFLIAYTFGALEALKAVAGAPSEFLG